MGQYIEPFSCDVTEEQDHVVVSPRGELDMATVGVVDDKLRRLHDSGVRVIVLDLGGLSFMDSTGLHLIIKWSSEASKDGFEFELEPGPPIVQRIFDLTSVTDQLSFRTPPE